MATRPESTEGQKPRVAVHKFSSCDGCQLAFLNMGEDLFRLNELVDVVHFVEAGPVSSDALVDIAFVEGSISTPEDVPRIESIRKNSRYLVTIGACATSGGLQALRNFSAEQDWSAAIYTRPEYIATLDKVTPISTQVRVDLELWGCPVSSRQVVAAIRSLLLGVTPQSDADKVCMECKRQQVVCVLVSKGEACLGPVTRTGCGALCPSFGRECYGCYGPAENLNAAGLARRFTGLGLLPETVARRFHYIHSATAAFASIDETGFGAMTQDETDGQA